MSGPNDIHGKKCSSRLHIESQAIVVRVGRIVEPHDAAICIFLQCCGTLNKWDVRNIVLDRIAYAINQSTDHPYQAYKISSVDVASLNIMSIAVVAGLLARPIVLHSTVAAFVCAVIATPANARPSISRPSPVLPGLACENITTLQCSQQ